MPAQVLQIIGVAADLAIFIFVIVYLFRYRSREKELAEKEQKVENDYSKIVQEALAKEKQVLDGAMTEANKILEVTTHQADQIIQGAQYISQNSIAILDQA